MQIISRAFSSLGTNCYIISSNVGEIIIDPGIGAAAWVKENVKNPLAIINTHGHFDHVFSDAALRRELDCAIYLPSGDEILVRDDPFEMLEEPFEPDILMRDGDGFCFGDLRVEFIKFSGHTPGGGAIISGEFMFSGDFIFKGSVGRTDFKYGDASQMANSIQKVLQMPNFTLLPGHGESSNLDAERANLARIQAQLTRFG